jgi:ubiquitin
MDKASNKIDKTQYQTYITLAGGRIRCLRCTARSVRSGEQCRKPAMMSSKTQKCTHHGGLSKGAITAEGKQRIIDANLTHGQSTRAAREEHSKVSARLSMLEDCMYALGMTTEPRIRGRKPAGYVPVRSLDDVRRVLRGLTL